MSFGETEPSQIFGGAPAPAAPISRQVTFDRRELNRIFGLYGRMVAAGLIDDASKLWWDVRLSARYPTLEMRITDVPTRLDDSAANRSQSRGGAQPVSAGAPRGRQDGRPGGMSSGGMRPGMGRPAGQESTGSSAMALRYAAIASSRLPSARNASQRTFHASASEALRAVEASSTCNASFALPRRSRTMARLHSATASPGATCRAA